MSCASSRVPRVCTYSYRKGGDAEDEEEGKEEHEKTGVFVDHADKAINDKTFWPWLGIFDGISAMICFLMAFVTSCPCHWRLELEMRRAEQDGLRASVDPETWKQLWRQF